MKIQLNETQEKHKEEKEKLATNLYGAEASLKQIQSQLTLAEKVGSVLFVK